jgi:26S proteasome regulatory subunit T5
MSSTQPPSEPPSNNNEKDEPTGTAPNAVSASSDAAMDTTPDQPEEETWSDIPEDILQLSTEDVIQRTKLIENDMKARYNAASSANDAKLAEQVIRSETTRLQHDQSVMKEKIRDNGEKVKQNKVLPYLVGNVVEVCICGSSY